METHIQIKHLNVRYDGQPILKDVCLEIPRKQITVIMGPSGCGKTTLLKSMNRFLELHDNAHLTGQVLIDGEDIYAPGVDVTEIRKKAGLLAQRPFPLPMSIFDNVAAGLRLNGTTKKKTLEEVVERSLRQAALFDEVKDILDRSGVSLSGGQQQRLCIARALAVDPEVILMDEPASALDPIATSKIEELIQELKKNYTIVIVTHNMQQAARVSGLTAFFYLGKLIEFGETDRLFTSPQKKQTEDYITGRFG